MVLAADHARGDGLSFRRIRRILIEPINATIHGCRVSNNDADAVCGWAGPGDAEPFFLIPTADSASTDDGEDCAVDCSKGAGNIS